MNEQTNSSIAPDIKKLDKIRATGYKPTVVACCVHDRQVVLFFKKDYRLWMLPQSGVDSSTDADQTVMQVISEELGKKFLSACSKSTVYLGEDQVEFLPEKQTNEEISLSDGSKSFKMIGKHYYFYAVEVATAEIDLSEGIYDEYYWLPSVAGMTLASKIYQPGKRRITLKAITLLKEKGLID
jgi:hypothetical protein